MEINDTIFEEVRRYKSPGVIERFCKIYGFEPADAELLFEDVKSWLALACLAKKEHPEKNFVIDHALVAIDEMWHNFVLFTHEYTQFCEKYFGGYLHHNPSTSENKGEESELMKKMSLEEKQKYAMDKLRWQYQYTMEKLGKETFLRWYQGYSRAYSEEVLAKLAYENTLKKGNAIQKAA